MFFFFTISDVQWDELTLITLEIYFSVQFALIASVPFCQSRNMCSVLQLFLWLSPITFTFPQNGSPLVGFTHVQNKMSTTNGCLSR